MKCKNGENIDEKRGKARFENLTKLDFEKQGLLRNVKAENLTKPDLQKTNKTQRATCQNLVCHPPAAISTYCLDASELLPCSGKRGKRWEAIPAGAK